MKGDPAFPDMKTPDRIQVMTVVFSFASNPKQVDWDQRIKDAFDFSSLAALLK